MHISKVEFGPPSHGWMELTFGSRKTTVSDVPCDSLYGLVKCMRNFLLGSSKEVVDWSLEPEYEKWVFERNDDREVFHILNFDSEAQITTTNPIRLIAILANELDKLYQKSFKDNPSIEENWSWDFPLDSLRALQAELVEQAVPPKSDRAGG